MGEWVNQQRVFTGGAWDEMRKTVVRTVLDFF